MKQKNNSQPFRAIRSKSCSICSTKIDYKDPKGLANFTSGRGKINPSRISSVCAKHQRQLRNFLIRARYLALLPYVTYRDSSNY